MFSTDDTTDNHIEIINQYWLKNQELEAQNQELMQTVANLENEVQELDERLKFAIDDFDD